MSGDSGQIIVLLLVAAPVALFLLFSGGKKATLKADKWPVFKKRVVTEREHAIFLRLREALPEFLVFPNISLESFIGVDNVQGRRKFQRAIKQHVGTFVVCDHSFTPLVVFEIDHGLLNKDEHGQKLKILNQAGVMLYRIPAQEDPSIEVIRTALGLPELSNIPRIA